MINCKVEKSKDCVLIEVGNWVHTSQLSIQKINGKISNSCITPAVDVHIYSEHFMDCPIKKGDYLLLNSVVADVATMRNFTLNDEKKYFYVPIPQVMGIFENNLLSLKNLKLLYDKILIEKINTGFYNNIAIPQTHEMIGKIIKVGSHKFTKDWQREPLRVKVGDLVILKDNIATPIRLGDKEYYVAEERNVVGIFKNSLAIEDIEFINEYILLKSYYPKKVLNSTILETPNINYEDLDYSDVYNRNLFQIEYLDKKIKKLKRKDIVIVLRDYTNYVYLNQDKYFLLDGEKWVSAIIKE